MIRRASNPLRVLVLAASVGVAAGCASDGPSSAPAGVPAQTAMATSSRPAEISDSAARIVPPVEAPAPPATDPHETFVANIREDIAVLEAFDRPDGEPAVFEYAITNPTYFGHPLALMITDRTEDGHWIEVQVPVRPNGTHAWIRVDDAEITSHRFRAEVDLTRRSLTVWNGEDVVVETTAVIGKPATPTPVGRFFVNDLIEQWDGSAYGPHILSLSGFSEAMETFAGGVPVIAIHGTNRPDLMGGAHSNGCVRVPNDVVELLATTVPIGTPVDIVA